MVECERPLLSILLWCGPQLQVRKLGPQCNARYLAAHPNAPSAIAFLFSASFLSANCPLFQPLSLSLSQIQLLGWQQLAADAKTERVYHGPNELPAGGLATPHCHRTADQSACRVAGRHAFCCGRVYGSCGSAALGEICVSVGTGHTRCCFRCPCPSASHLAFLLCCSCRQPACLSDLVACCSGRHWTWHPNFWSCPPIRQLLGWRDG